MADPALPSGFSLDSGSATPALPAGYSIDAPKVGGTPLVQTSPKSFSTKDRSGRSIAFTVNGDATDDEIRQAAAKAVGSKAYLRSEVQRGEITPTDQSKLTGFVGGMLKPLDNAAQWIGSTRIGQAVDQFGHDYLGMPTVDEAVAHNDAMRAGNARTGYQTLGNITATIPLSRLPGGMATQGAAGGALLSEGDHPIQVAEDAAKGAVASVVGGKLLTGLSTLAGGVKNEASQLLYKAGVPQTLGQLARNSGTLAGKIVGGIEDRAAGFPVIGDMINAARDRGIKGLNLSLGNRVLANVGEKLPAGTAAGHDMLDAVQGQLSARYGKLVPNLTGTLDQNFADDLAKAKAITATLPDQRQKQLASIVSDVFKNRVQPTPNGGFQIVPMGANGSGGPSMISGQALKDAESQLTKLYGKYSGARGDEGVFADAIEAVRQSLRNMVLRSNPAHAQELQGLNTAWAQLGTLRQSVRSGTDLTKATGLLSPGGALRTTARAGFRDPLLETATEVLPNRVPDSGTAGRASLALLGTGGASAAAAFSHPVVAGSVVAGSLPYTEVGQNALNALLLAPRGKTGQVSAVALKNLAKYAPGVSPALVTAAGAGSGQK